MKQSPCSLQDNSFLKHFSPDGQARLLRAAETRSLKDGALLFDEGDPSDCVSLVLDGRIEIFKPSLGGRTAVIGSVGPGDYLGELGVLAEEPRSVSARARTDTAVAVMPVAAVREVLAGEPTSTALSFLSRTVEYLRLSNQRYTTEVLRKGKTQLVGEMSGSIIHDLRNPIATIDLAVQVLLELHDDGPSRKACEAIRRHAMHMTDMLQDLQDFSGGEIALDRKQTPLAPLLDELRELNERRTKEAHIRLSVSADDVAVPADPGRLLRALENLVGNSRRAIGEKGGSIELTAVRKGDHAEITVRDDGPGIAPEVRKNLFEPFVSRWERPRTGLGLAIVKNIVGAHGGTVSFESESGRGALFKILLPLSA
ncbi:MAG: ATP-binding protein [Elusimicrobiota bacterium]